MAIKTVVFTSGTNYTIPGDFVQLVSVDVIGAGAGTVGNNGGRGGDFAQSTSIANIQPGGFAHVSMNASPTSWFSYGIGNNPPTNSLEGALAAGGDGGGPSIGTTVASGGTGGIAYFILGSSNLGGGGGAGGPNGAGGNGGDGGTGGGGGGSAAANSSTGSGGAYGGGAGGSNENPRPTGGAGLVVFIYSTTLLNSGNFLALF